MANIRQTLGKPSAAGAVGSFSLHVLAIAWHITRLLIVALLTLAEPIVGFILCGLALVGLIASVILKFCGAAPNFPFWPALAMSVGLYVAFLLYVVVVRSLVPRPHEDGDDAEPSLRP